MRALRYAAALVLFSVWHASRVVLAGLVRIPHRPGGVYDRAGGEWARAVLKWCRIGVVVEGRERLDPKAPCVYIANHVSFLDILAILQEFPGSLRFVYKKGMSWIPILGWAMLFARHIPIGRRNRAERVPRGSGRPRPGIVTHRIGAAMPPAGMSYDAREQLAGRTRAAIVGMRSEERRGGKEWR